MITSEGKSIELESEFIELGNKEPYFVIAGKEIDKGVFYLASAVKIPIEDPVLLKVRVNNNGKIEAYKYQGEDYGEIFKSFFD